MNRILLLSSCLILVSGCGAMNQAQLNAGMKQANEAAASCDQQAIPQEIVEAWEQVAKEDARLCPVGSDSNPIPPSQSIETNQCRVNNIKRYVLPIEKDAASLNKLIERYEESAKKYQNGKIDRNTANQEMMVAYHEYVAKKVSYFKFAQCKNAALQHYVMPFYTHKGLLMDLLSRQSEIGLAIDNGEMSVEQGDIEMQRAWASVAKGEQQANMVIQAQNAQRGAAMQAFGLELLKDPPQTDTNCTVGLSGRSINCTTR